MNANTEALNRVTRDSICLKLVFGRDMQYTNQSSSENSLHGEIGDKGTMKWHKKVSVKLSFKILIC